jgi:nucleoside 2-deoxyribosyltransferase
MKIVICGSSSFRNKKVEIRDKLNSFGHEAIIDIWTEKLAKGEAEELAKRIEKEHSEVKKEYDLIRLYYNIIKDCEAILVINLDKNNIKNYIGANTFLEMGYAYYLNKKIFLFNPLPEQDYLLDELKTINPIVINQDLSKIN